MYDPPHPGEILREDCVPASGLSVAEVAERLGVTTRALSELLNEQANMCVDMAIRLEERMKWSTAEMWLRIQAAYDIWQARHRR